MSEYNLTFREALIAALQGETIETTSGYTMSLVGGQVMWHSGATAFITDIDYSGKDYRIKKPKVKRAQYIFKLFDGGVPIISVGFYRDDMEFALSMARTPTAWFKRGEEREFDE